MIPCPNYSNRGPASPKQASTKLVHGRNNQDRWVSPFGNRRVKGCSHLTDAYRSVPRPSSPVCAKASTNCPYLTLESPHHQRQRWVDLTINQNSAEQRVSWILVRMIKMLSLIIWRRPGLLDPISKANPLHRLSQTERRIYGIDFKNPFTMSNTRGVPLSFPHECGTAFSSSLDICGRASCAPRARQSQQSLS